MFEVSKDARPPSRLGGFDNRPLMPFSLPEAPSTSSALSEGIVSGKVHFGGDGTPKIPLIPLISSKSLLASSPFSAAESVSSC